MTTNLRVWPRAQGKSGSRGSPSTAWRRRPFWPCCRTAERLQERAAEILKPHGLSPTQYNALRILRGAGPPGLACREIGERMIHHDPDITRLLDRLQRRGLVARSRSREDRRVMKTRITEAGLAAPAGARVAPSNGSGRRFARPLGQTSPASFDSVARGGRRGRRASRIAADDPATAGLADSTGGATTPPAWLAELRGRRRPAR